MTSLVIKGFLLSFVLSYSTAYTYNEFKSHFLWKTNLALISLLENPIVFADSAAPPEESKKLKEKIKKGREILEKFNVNLEKIKKSLSENKEVEKEVLDRIIEIKDEFAEMQVDSTDLPKDLIEKFRVKTIEAFKLIMESFGINKVLQKKKATDQPKVDVKHAESKPDTTEAKSEVDVIEAEPEAEVIDNKVDNKAERKFEEEL